MSRAASLLLSLCGVAVVGVVVYKVGPPAVADKLAFLGQPPADAPPADPVAAGHARGVAYLLKHQSDDGAWRSDVYALFKDGTALTPLVLCALQDAGGEESAAARRKASDWLAKRAKPDGTIDEGKDGIPYQVYTAALTVTALSHPENKHHLKARDAWLKYLLDRQLSRENGWVPSDKQFGGWGYYPGIPKKPAPGQAVPAQQLLETNISATVFALDALYAAYGNNRTPPLGHYIFEEYQNPDGGFFFIHDDPVRNKAGSSGTYPNGSLRFHSYGSATADAVRGWWYIYDHYTRPEHDLMCFRPPQPHKGLNWLTTNFAADRHPGTYIPTHEPNRNAVYFYYARSVAKTFRLCGVKEGDGWFWARPLAEALVAKQRPDGSWANPVELVRENDPVLATAYAVSALAECRKALTK